MLAERTLGRHQEPKTSLGGALDLYAEQHVAQLAPRAQKELERLFRRYLTKLRTKIPAEITTHDITALTDKAAPSEGEHLHRACKTFFKRCVRRRMLQHSPLEGLELPSMWKPRERVLNDDELRAVWKASDDCGQFGVIVKLLIATGQRRSEVGSLRFEWLDLDKRTWTTPSTYTKNKRSHTFPISPLSVSILETTGMKSGFLFLAKFTVQRLVKSKDTARPLIGRRGLDTSRFT
jgi:integrase